MNASTSCRILAVLLVLFAACADDPQQTGYVPEEIDGPVVFTSGLRAPSRVILTGSGKLLVAEAGDGDNTGRISIIHERGERLTLVDGLPAGVSSLGDQSGPSGIDLEGLTLYVSIGEGDGLVSDASGADMPNPDPVSPLVSSVLAFDLGADFERMTNGFTFGAADHATVAGGGVATLQNGAGDSLRVRLVVNFPNSAPDPFLGFRASNPYGVAVAGGSLYVNDAGMNKLYRVSLGTGGLQTLAQFPGIPNPLPFGPPVMDAVPDNVRLLENSLLVPLLPGFPFPPGSSVVRRVDANTGAVTTFISGLTSALDALPASIRGGSTQYFVIEISTDLLADAPGRLLRFDNPPTTPTVIAGNLIGPTSVAVNGATGDLFITEIFTGNIIRAQID